MDKDLGQNVPSARNWILIVLLLIGLWLASAILANFVSIFKTAPDVEINGNVAIIPVKGAIRGDPSGGTFSTNGAPSSRIVNLLEKAGKKDKIKAVVLEINSPGGSAVASQEIARAVKDLNKTTVAWIREVGASGAYWVASATDHIVASELSTTGSIGVLASYLEYSDLLERFNITHERLVGGEYKDLGSPYKDLTDEERKILEDKLETAHNFFIRSVAENRNMSVSRVREFADGLAYFGKEAEEMGLVDEIGGEKEALNYIEEDLNITANPVRFRESKNVLSLLQNLVSEHGYRMGAGLSESLEAEDKAFVART